MSFLDLKKSTPCRENDVSNKSSCQDFIDGAVAYANGVDTKIKGHTSEPFRVTNKHAGEALQSKKLSDNSKKTHDQLSDLKCSNVTFSFTSKSREELKDIAARTGISKSRLLRILIHDQYHSQDTWLYSQQIK